MPGRHCTKNGSMRWYCSWVTDWGEVEVTLDMSQKRVVTVARPFTERIPMGERGRLLFPRRRSLWNLIENMIAWTEFGARWSRTAKDVARCHLWYKTGMKRRRGKTKVESCKMSCLNKAESIRVCLLARGGCAQFFWVCFSLIGLDSLWILQL